MIKSQSENYKICKIDNRNDQDSNQCRTKRKIRKWRVASEV